MLQRKIDLKIKQLQTHWSEQNNDESLNETKEKGAEGIFFNPSGLSPVKRTDLMRGMSPLILLALVPLSQSRQFGLACLGLTLTEKASLLFLSENVYLDNPRWRRDVGSLERMRHRRRRQLAHLFQ